MLLAQPLLRLLLPTDAEATTSLQLYDDFCWDDLPPYLPRFLPTFLPPYPYPAYHPYGVLALPLLPTFLPTSLPILPTIPTCLPSCLSFLPTSRPSLPTISGCLITRTANHLLARTVKHDALQHDALQHGPPHLSTRTGMFA